MGVNFVEFSNGETVVDLRKDTINPDVVFEGYTGHDAQGEPIAGTFPNGEIDTQSGLIEQIKTALDGKAAGGGKNSEPDLVIGFELDEEVFFTVTNSSVVLPELQNNLYIKSGSVSDTYTKLINGEKVIVYIDCEYWYGYYSHKCVLKPFAVSAVTNDVIGASYLAINVHYTPDIGSNYAVESMGIQFNLDGTLKYVLIQ